MSIKVNNLDRALSRIKNVRDLNRVVNSATKRTERGAKTDVSSAIRKELALKKRYVDEKISVRGNYSAGNNTITIRAEKRGILFRSFRHFVSQSGQMRITIKPGQVRTIKNVWMLNLKQGGQTPVFWKDRPQIRKGSRGYWDGLAMHAPSPSQVFNTKKEEIGDQVRDRLRDQIITNINNIRYLR